MQDSNSLIILIAIVFLTLVMVYSFYLYNKEQKKQSKIGKKEEETAISPKQIPKAATPNTTDKSHVVDTFSGETLSEVNLNTIRTVNNQILDSHIVDTSVVNVHSFVSNIACAVPNCQNPVIGQCSGYNHHCGRYYCAEYSVDNLCIKCAQQKIAEDKYIDYLHTSEKLRKDAAPLWGGVSRFLISLFLGLGVFVIIFL